MHCEQIWEERGGIWRLTGKLEHDDVMRLILDRNLDCRFRKAEYLVHDFLGATDLVLSEGDLSAIVDNEADIAGLAPNLKMAFVTDDERFDQLFERFIEKMQDCSWEIKVFREFEAAYEWATRK